MDVEVPLLFAQLKHGHIKVISCKREYNVRFAPGCFYFATELEL